jgi:hypothetical protein
MLTAGWKRELVGFFMSYFYSKKGATRFIEKCEGIPEQEQNAKLMLNQTQRLVTLADEIYKIKQRDSLRLLFLIICAEAVAKLHEDFRGEGKSKYHTRLFFNKLCEPKDLKRLKGALLIRAVSSMRKKRLSSEEVINYFYKVRCSVIHEGIYWGFEFKRRGNNTGIITASTNEVIYPKITYKVLRDIIVRGAIKAINDCIDK